MVLYPLVMITFASCLWLYFKIKGESQFDEQGDPKIELDPKYTPQE